MGNRNGVEITDANLKSGDEVKIKGKISANAERFWIGLGTDECNQALNISYSFSGDRVIVLNSCCNGCWGKEQNVYMSLDSGAEVKFEVKLHDEVFDVKLPGGQVVQFKRRDRMRIINWIKVAGDIECTCVC